MIVIQDNRETIRELEEKVIVRDALIKKLNKEIKRYISMIKADDKDFDLVVKELKKVKKCFKNNLDVETVIQELIYFVYNKTKL